MHYSKDKNIASFVRSLVRAGWRYQMGGRHGELISPAGRRIFVDKLKDKGFTQHANLHRWLVMARALARLEESSPVPLRDVMHRHLLLGRQVRDIENFLRDIARREGQKRLELALRGR